MIRHLELKVRCKQGRQMARNSKINRFTKQA
jgi:hypothetical protein